MKHFTNLLFLLAFFVSLAAQAQIVFDGSPGTSAPPATLGGYTMSSIVDSRANGSVVSSVASPISGSIGFGSTQTIYTPGQNGVVTWGNGYTGRIYFHDESTNSLTLTLPANTKAFYFYATQNRLNTTYTITAATQNNSAGSVQVTTDQSFHAKYIGFYVNQPSASIETITIDIQNPTNSAGLVVGQFGIAQCFPSTPMIVGLADKFCQDGPAVSLNGNGSGGTYTIDGVTSTTLTPSSLTVGQHTVVYKLTNPGGCSNTATQMVTIVETPQTPKLVSASGQPYPASASSLTVSQNTGTVSLSVSGCEGGTINWMGGSASTYAVSTANLGTQTFTATCTRNGCTSPAATARVTVVGVGPGLKVLSRDPDNGQLNSNTLKPYLVLQNDGNSPIPYGAITVRYWLTTEANIPLIFQINYAQLGSDKVHLRYVPLATPRQGATGYIEFSFDGSAGSLGAMSNSGPIQDLINKQDYSAFNQLDDYSYVNNSNFALNQRITAYVNGVLVYGMEPGMGGGSPRQGVAESESILRVSVLGNPIVGQNAEVEIRGVEGQAVQVHLVNLQGRLVHQLRIEQPTSLERVSVPLGGEQGILLLQVSTPTQRQQVKLLKQ